jgi:hypothetical protein
VINISNRTENSNVSFALSAADLAPADDLQWPTLETPNALELLTAKTWDAPLNLRRFAAPLPARVYSRAQASLLR